ncbi:MAG: hypothetical protein JWP63_5220, partial [Candidatus Solibacter sp.]|nr:hypothetical protein [Candidatus Solibacter sp.]
MRISRILTLSAFAGIMALGSANAGQIAQISELGGLNDFTITNSGTGTVTLSASSQVGFTYSASIFPPTI